MFRPVSRWGAGVHSDGSSLFSGAVLHAVWLGLAVLTGAVVAPAAPPVLRDVAVIPGHGHGVFGAAVSPNGELIATGSADQTLKIWRRSDGQLLRTFFREFGSSDVLFSADSSAIFSAGNGGAAGWDLTTGTPLGDSGFFGMMETGGDLDCSADGTLLLVAGTAGGTEETAQIVRVSDGAIVQQFNRLESHVVSAGRFIPNSNRIVTGSSGVFGSSVGFLRFWDLDTGELLQTIEIPGNGILGLDVSANGESVAVASWDGRVELRSAADGAFVRAFVGHTGLAASVAFSPAGDRLASVGADGVLRIWNAATAELVDAIPVGAALADLAWTPDGGQIVAVSGAFAPPTNAADNHVRVIDVPTASEVGRLTQLTASTTTFAISPNGGLLAVPAIRDVKLIARDTFEVVDTIAVGESSTGIAFSPNGKSLALSGFGSVRTVDLTDGSTRVFEEPPTPFSIVAVAYSPDGALLVAGNLSGSAQIYDAATGVELQEIFPPGFGTRAAQFTPDGAFLVTGGANAYLWRTSDWQRIRGFGDRSFSVSDLEITADGSTLVIGTVDGAVELYTLDNSDPIQTFDTAAGWVQSVAISPNGRWVAAVTDVDDQLLYVWDVETGALRATEPIGNRPTGLMFSDDGRSLALLRVDGTIRFLNVPFSVDGDMNCDGVVTVSDINPFVLALTDVDAFCASFPDCAPTNGDFTRDGVLTVSDINDFVAALTDR